MEKNVTLISSRTMFQNFINMRECLRKKRKRYDITSLILARNMVGAAEAMIKGYRRCVEAKRGVKYTGGNTASSGIVAVVVLRHLCHSVSLYGGGGGGARLTP